MALGSANKHTHMQHIHVYVSFISIHKSSNGVYIDNGLMNSEQSQLLLMLLLPMPCWKILHQAEIEMM